MKRTVQNVLYAAALSGLLATFLRLFHPAYPMAYIGVAFGSYTLILLWALLSFAWKATWFEIKIQVPVAFLLTAVLPPAVGRIAEHMGYPLPDVIMIYFHVTTLATVVLPAIGDHMGRKMRTSEEFVPRCKVCRYNLTGLHSSRCPECGTAIEWEDVKNCT